MSGWVGDDVPRGDVRADRGPMGMTWITVSRENWLVGCSYISLVKLYFEAMIN
jgi:hypothetical protein